MPGAGATGTWRPVFWHRGHTMRPAASRAGSTIVEQNGQATGIGALDARFDG
jgi:hypothetical protein